MLERFLELKSALLEMLNKEECKAHHKCLGMIKERDWPTMENIVSVLKIFYEVTNQLSHRGILVRLVMHQILWGEKAKSVLEVCSTHVC